MPKKLDLTGQQFGKWTVLKKSDEKTSSGGTKWTCQCECGTIKDVAATSLRSGGSKSCGCERKRMLAKSLAGQTFGRLTVLEITDERRNGKVVWKCQCECGNVHYTTTNALTTGASKSCGCLAREIASQVNKKDLTGQKFGRLTVLEEIPERTQDGVILWKCQCECGTIKNVRANALTSGATQSCGCLTKEKAAILNFKDLTGQKFGKLTVIEKTNERDSSGSIKWKCICECGNTYITTTRSLTCARTKSCGCLSKLDLTNQRFGKLIAIRPTEERRDDNVVWECKCDCGNICYVTSTNLNRGLTKSCGCLNQSAGEFEIEKLLKENNISFEREKSFETCQFKDTNKPARFDFYINNQYLIEFDGRQHFTYQNNWGATIEDFQKRQEHDKIKTQWCKKNNIPLIRIPYTHLNDLKLEDLLLETSTFKV